MISSLSAIINKTTLELIQGDITQQDTDAIVNAANNTLLGGSGVDGAIHRAAGPELLRETSGMGGCKTGDAKISKGYRLKARFVIHTVGPVYYSAGEHAPRLLVSAHRRSLELALQHEIKSIAFPAISTGVYGYPLNEASPLALRTVIDFAAKYDAITLVRFVLFDERSFNAYADALLTHAAQSPDKVRLA